MTPNPSFRPDLRYEPRRPVNSDVERQLFSALNDRIGSGRDEQHPQLAAGNRPLKIRFPEAAIRHRVLATLSCLMTFSRATAAY